MDVETVRNCLKPCRCPGPWPRWPPTIISQLITMVYNLADTYFIGQTNNPYMVAAASLSYTLFFILTALSNLFGVGGGSLISRLLAQGRDQEARKVCAFSFYSTILVSLLYCGGCFFWMNPLLRLLGPRTTP